MPVPIPKDLTSTIASHEAAIQTLGGRMSGVENSVRTLQGEVHVGFSALGSKLDRLDAAPKFDFHKTIKTVSSLAVLFAAVCGGIIYIVSAQNAADRARQEILNATMAEKVNKAEQKIDWLPMIERRNK